MTEAVSMSRYDTRDNQPVGADAVEHIRSLLPANDEVGRLLAQERLRVRLTDGLRSVRTARGLSQADVADRLGITQGRVSRLESADFDRRLDSIAAYMHAVGAKVVLAFEVDGRLFPVMVPDNVRIEVSNRVEMLGSANVDFTVHSEPDLEPSPEASYEFDYYASAA